MSAIDRFSEQIIEAAEKIISGLVRGNIFWAILVAQMQSGKTETYLLACCEMIRREFVEAVVIFSGNSETDLRDQLKREVNNGSKFAKKYRKYLRDVRHLSTEEAEEISEAILLKFTVVWGTELNKYDKFPTKTLFVWEEAHHAQSIHQCPDKFLTKVGISADGDSSVLEEKGNYVITVSATPFSELSDLHHLHQNKKVVYLEPGINNVTGLPYNSVQRIRDGNRLISFTNIDEGLRRALRKEHTSSKYAIVRITNKNEDDVKRIIEENGWLWVVFDSLAKGELKELGERVWAGMDKAPERDTVILLRGKCRMGKNLHKKHVLFVMETARNSKTDTVLQGLLGRVCGYAEGSELIDVYLHQKIIQSGEIDRYINLIESISRDGPIQFIPTKGKNITGGKFSKNDPIIPIRITRDRTISPTNDRSHIIADVLDALTVRTPRLENKNDDRVLDEVSQKFMAACREDRRRIKTFGLHDRKKTRNGVVANKLRNSFQQGTPDLFGSGCGIDAEGLEINIWFPRKIEGFSTEEFYVTAYVVKRNLEDFLVPSTTKKEVFAHRLEDGTEVEANGGFVIPLPYKTAYDVDEMQEEICEFVEMCIIRTQNQKPCIKKVSSCWDENNKEFKGVLVNPSVLRALEKDGSIWRHVHNVFQVTLTIEKSKGPTPKAIKEKGYIKLASISW
jgi:hypothetical protein